MEPIKKVPGMDRSSMRILPVVPDEARELPQYARAIPEGFHAADLYGTILLNWSNKDLTIEFHSSMSRSEVEQRLTDNDIPFRIQRWFWERWMVDSQFPSEVMRLPSTDKYYSLASRNPIEVEFEHEHSVGMTLGTMENHAVRVQPPARIMYLTPSRRIPSVFHWLTREWPGKRVFVLDASDIGKGWQDTTTPLFISLNNMDVNAAMLNPLMTLDGDTTTTYAERVLAWINGVTSAGLKIENPEAAYALLRERATHIMRGLVYSLADQVVNTEYELNPKTLMAAFGNPERFDVKTLRLQQTIPAETLEVWKTRDWSVDRAGLDALIGYWSRFISQKEISTIWMPPYNITSETVGRAGWFVMRAPLHRTKHKVFWKGMWPLVSRLAANPNSLVLCLNMKNMGREALSLTDEGASVVVYGNSLENAVGSDEPPDAHYVLGGVTDATHLVTDDISTQCVLAQASDQAIAMLRTEKQLDVGSILLKRPSMEKKQRRGWVTRGGHKLPTPTVMMGDVGDVTRAMAHIARSTLDIAQDSRIMILAPPRTNSAFRSVGVEPLVVSHADMPTVNPLIADNGKRDLRRWLWWGKGLGIPGDIIQTVYRNKDVNTLQDFLYAAKAHANVQTVDKITSILSSKLFGAADSKPTQWFEHSQVLLIEAVNAALVRYFLLTAVESRAKLMLWWNGDGVIRSDIKPLRAVSAVLYPATNYRWCSQMLMLSSLTSRINKTSLPDDLVMALERLGRTTNEGVLWERGESSITRVMLEK